MFNVKRNPFPFICLICILLLGMCFGNAPADSFLEYADGDSFQVQDNFPSAAIRSGSSTVPLAQIYKNKNLSQLETALSLRSGAGKASVRTGRSFRSSLIFSIILLLSLSLPYAASRRLPERFQEVISNTVIINYIHRQDGQKSISPIIFTNRPN